MQRPLAPLLYLRERLHAVLRPITHRHVVDFKCVACESTVPMRFRTAEDAHRATLQPHTYMACKCHVHGPVLPQPWADQEIARLKASTANLGKRHAEPASGFSVAFSSALSLAKQGHYAEALVAIEECERLAPGAGQVAIVARQIREQLRHADIDKLLGSRKYVHVSPDEKAAREWQAQMTKKDVVNKEPGHVQLAQTLPQEPRTDDAPGPAAGPPAG